MSDISLTNLRQTNISCLEEKQFLKIMLQSQQTEVLLKK